MGFGEINHEGRAGWPVGGLVGVLGFRLESPSVGLEGGAGWPVGGLVGVLGFRLESPSVGLEGGAGWPVGGLVGVLGFEVGRLESPSVGLEGGAGLPLGGLLVESVRVGDGELIEGGGRLFVGNGLDKPFGDGFAGRLATSRGFLHQHLLFGFYIQQLTSCSRWGSPQCLGGST